MDIEYGAKVVDKDGKLVGKVDYLAKDSYTREIKSFKVSSEATESDVVFSIDDVDVATALEIRLKTSLGEPR